jgi:hypothetical protein
VSLVLRLAVDLAPADRGGRRRPITDGYRASLSFGKRRRDIEPVVHDAVLVLEDIDQLEPGAHGTARAYPFLEDDLPRSFGAGRVLTLLERDRIVGKATVLGFADDDTSQPLADLQAAKARSLILRDNR